MKTLASLALFGALLGACSEATVPDGTNGTNNTNTNGAPAHPDEGPHGGPLLEVGDHVAHIEVLHDEAAGKMTLYVLGQDGKTAVAVEEPPVLKLMGANDALTTDAVDGEIGAFSLSNEALNAHGPEGRITIKLNGKTYNPALVHAPH